MTKEMMIVSLKQITDGLLFSLVCSYAIIGGTIYGFISSKYKERI